MGRQNSEGPGPGAVTDHQEHAGQALGASLGQPTDSERLPLPRGFTASYTLDPGRQQRARARAAQRPVKQPAAKPVRRGGGRR
jgi:hypothetical protein